MVDLFAGPGGLNEGFSSLLRPDGDQVFRAVSSFEMDARACDTLRLRSAVRSLRGSTEGLSFYSGFLNGEISWSQLIEQREVAAGLRDAERHVQQVELGPASRDASSDVIRDALSSAGGGPWVLIGGPPCQAYSLVGRARRTNDATFGDDVKHFLYREYLDIIERHRPPVFVMENVKGLLSHTHGGAHLFSRIIEDLSTAGDGYEIRSFVVDPHASLQPTKALAPKDYVIRSEEYGVPQKRHRVILLGVQSGLTGRSSRILTSAAGLSVEAVLADLPSVRSQISPKREDTVGLWRSIRSEALQLAGERRHNLPVPASTGFARGGKSAGMADGILQAWLTNRSGGAVTQHEARSHMPTDLMRYAYLAARAKQGHIVKVDQLPEALRPNHANIGGPNTPFSDRFRVQRLNDPSTTITSHISKDGHYYIHPDPSQMRSLTVREAARLQTFPDDYFFCGNRTQQYHQVGNAVPPFLARQLAEVVADFLGVGADGGRGLAKGDQ
ncbi:modification methylase (Cytosine-specific methyltransferase) [Janibacter sp. HTCC2649]|nr:modification methylase (Cytosine-specific methyltransferase) [Janibacter sp. HTCC2649]